ncbi:MAG: HNH endonuclease family protein [Pseudoclavibacter sp.]
MRGLRVSGTRAATLAAVLVLALVLIGYLVDSAAQSASTPAGASSSPSLSPTSPLPQAGRAAALLATLPVKGRAPRTGYDRVGDFGPAWRDVDRNGCDTRDDILARDLAQTVRSGACKVTSGTLHSAYSGRTVAFTRGVQTSAQVQIDHMVPLMDAWQTGAQRLSAAERLALANDPLNLQAVEGDLNEQKSDSDAASWLPPRRAYWCPYVARQISVKHSYSLWVTPAEHDRMAAILQTCPGQPAYSSTLHPRP